MSQRTSTGRSHKDQSHLLRDGLGLGFAARKTAFQVLNASFELSDRGLESIDHLVCDGSHCGERTRCGRRAITLAKELIWGRSRERLGRKQGKAQGRGNGREGRELNAGLKKTRPRAEDAPAAPRLVSGLCRRQLRRVAKIDSQEHYVVVFLQTL